MGQFNLFGGIDEPTHPDQVRATSVPDAINALATQLPQTLRLGTSSWSFPGWRGLVYEDSSTNTEKKLAQFGLEAYAQYPLFRTVGIDRSHYSPLPAQEFARYAAQVPPDFRLLVKAHEACTLGQYPTHPRYGTLRGQINPQFLDPEYATRAVIEPTVEGLGNKLGPILFQFAAQPMQVLGGSPAAFFKKLATFLRQLPKGPLYAFEIRNPQLMLREYVAMLAEFGAVHCINGNDKMPSPAMQAIICRQALGDNSKLPFVGRWMLAPNHTFESANVAFEPFDKLFAPDVVQRKQWASIVHEAVSCGRDAWLIINNNAEGCAALSIGEFASELALRRNTSTTITDDDVPF